MKRALQVAAVLVVFAASGLPGQQQAGPMKKSQPSSFSFQVNPGLEIPFGESAQYFSLGGSLELRESTASPPHRPGSRQPL